MFDQDEERFATLGLAAKLPSAVIDGIWDIIDQNLKESFACHGSCNLP